MPTITATTAAERKADRRAEALAKLNPATIPAVQTGDRVLIAPGYGHSAVGATVVETPIIFRDRERGTSKMSGRIILESMVLVTTCGLSDRWASFRRRT